MAIDRDAPGADVGLARNDGREARVAEIDDAVQAWTLQYAIDEFI